MRVTVLVDGMNLYHSLGDAIEDGCSPSVKWLNIHSLCTSLLHVFNDRTAKIESVYYFTSLVTHRAQAAARRQSDYLRALRAEGGLAVKGEFREKTVYCGVQTCLQPYPIFVEKKTDVNIAIKLFELCHNDACDACVIVSGDSDLINALTTVKALFSKKKFGVFFPYKRSNPELSKQADCSAQLTAKLYEAHIFPNPVKSIDGDIFMPRHWSNEDKKNPSRDSGGPPVND